MNYSTLHFRYEENKMECRHLEDNHIERNDTNYNINDTRISDKKPTFGFVISKIICPKKKHIDQTYGFQPPIHHINSNIYINNFFPRRSITE